MDVELRAKRDALEYLWRQGLSGRALLAHHSELIDNYLQRSFRDCPQAEEGMALVALGGYGRQELFPYSDIDLLLLYKPGTEAQLGPVVEALFYPLWNAGLELGHSVRTPDVCLDDAGKDFFLRVALLDARLLAGSNELFADLCRAFRRELIDGHRQDFLHEMLLHRSKRHQRYGRHSHQLEPQIKEGRGGFRDVQAMLWVAQALFGMRDLDAIEEGGLLSSREKACFSEAIEDLIRMRNQLHYLSGRKNDQLFFECQKELAKALRYHEQGGVLAVERFMQDVYRQMQVIATTTDLFFEQVDETLGLSRPRETGEQELEPGIVIRHGRLHFSDREFLARKPHLLMRLFAQSGRTGLAIHHRSRKLVSENLDLINDKIRCSKRVAKAFFDILEQAEEPTAVLSVMLETGLLTAYLPEFAPLYALAQHDVYHVFTVDRHLLETVAALKKITPRQTPFGGVESPQVLALAALLHDIGKGHHDDHSRRGGELVTAIAGRLGLSDREADCLRFLVEKHLFLTLTALRRDLEDEAFIQQCARQIGTMERLAMLHRLSIADALATGPTAWNEWKAALVLELCLKLAHLLEGQELALPDQEQGARWMLDQLRPLLTAEQAADLSILPEEYLLSFTPRELARHLKLHAELGQKGQEKRVLVEQGKEELCWSVLVMAHDSTGLLSRICGTLALHDLKVVSAQIFTWADGTAVDLLNVRPAAGQAYTEQDWTALTNDLNLAIRNRLGLSHRLGNKFRSVIGRSELRLPGGSAPRVLIDNQASGLCTILEVYADNRPGLLYDITRTLAEFKINIHRAKIASDGDQAVDVFYLQDATGDKIDSPAFQAELSGALLHAAE